MPHVELRVVSGKQAGSTIPLQKGKFLIGREHDCHLRPNSDLVSRHHCAFTVDDYTVHVRDLGSTNGTFVNGERARGLVLLKPGDHVSVGKLEFEVVIDGQPASSKETVLRDLEDTATSLSGEFVVKPVDQPPAEEAAAADREQATVEINPQSPTAVEEFAAVAAPAGPPPQMPPQPWMVPQPVYPGGYPPYPGMPYGYGYPPYPGMPPVPAAGYPYPGPVPAATPGEAASPPAAPKELAGDVVPGVRLPDPKTTGAKNPDPPAPQSGDQSGASGKSEAKNIPSAAQDIINSYLHRRPKS